MKLTPAQFTLFLGGYVLISVLFAVACLVFAVRMHVFALPPRTVDEAKLKSSAVSPSLRLPLSLSSANYLSAGALSRGCGVERGACGAAAGREQLSALPPFRVSAIQNA